MKSILIEVGKKAANMTKIMRETKGNPEKREWRRYDKYVSISIHVDLRKKFFREKADSFTFLHYIGHMN